MKRILLLSGLCGFFLISGAQPLAPALVLPTDSAVNVLSSPTFDWHPSLGGVVTDYELQLDTKPNFGNPQIFNVVSSGTSMSQLEFDTDYYWRVRANSPAGISQWSDTFLFTTHANNIPLTAPSFDDTISHVAPTLTWNTADKSNFHFQLDTTPAFNSSELIGGTIINPFTANTIFKSKVEGLHFDQRYYWRVRAFHSNDTSDWTTTSEFTTIDVLTARAPADSLSNTGTLLQLRVFPMEGVDDYEFEVDNSTAFAPLSKEYIHFIGTSQDIYISDLLFGTTYNWRARAISESEISDWFGFWTFTTSSTVKLKSPAAGASVSQQPVLKWDTIAGAPLYEVQYDVSSSFTDPVLVVADSGGVGEVTIPEPLELGTYFWRVRAILASHRDTSDWSDTISFKVTPVGINEKNSAEFNMFPNPAGNVLNIIFNNLDNNNLTLKMMDVNGKVVIERNVSVNTGNDVEVLRLDDIANGIYVITLQGNGYFRSEKITISK